MGSSYIRPKDRPAKIWCKSHCGWVSGKGETVDLSNLSTLYCLDPRCGKAATGSVVYVFDDEPPQHPAQLTVPKKKEKPKKQEENTWTPHCGNSECDGTCNDPECILPENLEVVSKIEYKMMRVQLNNAFEKANKAIKENRQIKTSRIFVFLSGIVLGILFEAAWFYFGRS